MVLKKNELLLDLRKLETSIPLKFFKQLTAADLEDTPIVLRRGAVNIALGKLSRIRIGKNTIYGEVALEIEGHLEFEPVLDEDEKITGIKINKFVYVK